MIRKKATPAQNAKTLLDASGFDAINELLHKPAKLFWLNFRTGFTRGFAGIIGAAAAIVIIGFVVAMLGGLPYIGDFLTALGNAAQGK